MTIATVLLNVSMLCFGLALLGASILIVTALFSKKKVESSFGKPMVIICLVSAVSVVLGAVLWFTGFLLSLF